MLSLLPATESHYSSSFHVQRFCEMRAQRSATLIHATTRIQLSERQLIALEDLLIKRASEATSNDDVTARVNAVQDEFADSISFCSPRMWKLCRQTAMLLAMLLSLESTKAKRPSFGIRWRRTAYPASCAGTCSRRPRAPPKTTM
jgi:hypothetical protein